MLHRLPETQPTSAFGRVLQVSDERISDLMDDADLPQVYCMRAAAYLALGENVRADEDYEHALSLDPASAPAHYGRGMLLLMEGDLAGAQADFLAVVEQGNDPELSAQAQQMLVQMGVR